MSSSGPLAHIIAASKRSIDLTRRLLVGVTPATFARLPMVGGITITTNHPAFVLGHLALYPTLVLSITGRTPAEIEPASPPSGFESLFSRDTACVDDASNALYPPMDAVTDAYFRTYEHACNVLARVDPAVLDLPNPDANARRASSFPTVGYAVVYFMCGHHATHLGQFSAWRRCMGLPPA